VLCSALACSSLPAQRVLLLARLRLARWSLPLAGFWLLHRLCFVSLCSINHNRCFASGFFLFLPLQVFQPARDGFWGGFFYECEQIAFLESFGCVNT
jgi:hypothetical protein